MGCSYKVFEYDAASDAFRPGTLADKPPQANDAKCGFARHTVVANKITCLERTGKDEVAACHSTPILNGECKHDRFMESQAEPTAYSSATRKSFSLTGLNKHSTAPRARRFARRFRSA